MLGVNSGCNWVALQLPLAPACFFGELGELPQPSAAWPKCERQLQDAEGQGCIGVLWSTHPIAVAAQVPQGLKFLLNFPIFAG